MGRYAGTVPASCRRRRCRTVYSAAYARTHAGSLCLYDEKAKLLFSGDTLFAGGVGRSDLFGGDGEALARSLERILALPGDIRVFPGHGSETVVARERW